MAVGAEWKNPAARTAVARIHVPAQAAPRENVVGRLYARHQSHGFRLEKPRALEFAKIEHHSGITREIGRRREQTGVTGDAPHVTSRRIVHLPAEDFAVDPLGGSDAGQFGRRRQVARVRHFQWLINLARDEFVELHATDPLDDFAEKKKIDVAVAERPAWRRDRLFRAGHANGGLVAGP